MDYKVRLKNRAKKFVLEQSPKIQRMLIKQLEALVHDPLPPNSKELDAKLKIYKLTHKKYRMIYQIQGNKLVVMVVAIGKKTDVKTFYKELVKRLSAL